jgi:methyltransferase (TIGR00027 family)
VAAQRLQFARVPADEGDPAADDRLAADVAGATLVRPRGPGRRGGSAGPMHTYLRARTAFFDRVVTTALDRGVHQVVIAAAGYDGRALRYARPGVRWFEVDHPDTQADKRRRLDRLAIASDRIDFVAADFTVDDVGAGLSAAGLDPTAPTLFCCEGVAVYLERTVLAGLLGQMRAVAGPGSRLAISLPLARAPGGARRRFQAAVAAIGEPVRTTLTPDEAAQLLDETGWRPLPQPGDRAPAALVVLEPVPGRGMVA